MANRHRGEISALIDGERRTLCLTLGALAELEDAFGVDDLTALAARFERGRISAKDAIRIIGAGLRGAGAEIGDAEIGAMSAEGGLAGHLAIVAELLTATFAADGDGPGAGRGPSPANPSPARV